MCSSLNLWCLALVCLPIFQQVYSSTMLPESLHFLEPGDIVENHKTGLQIFCHRAKTKYLVHIWRSIIMNLNTNFDTYDLYDGRTPQEVLDKHEENQRSWKFNLFDIQKNKQLRINPFEDTCIGVFVHPYNEYKYTVSMSQINVDKWELGYMLVGVIIFFLGRRLSHNTLFYYLCGITLGVTTSVLILIYFFSKLLPRGKTMYLMVATGWTMSFYLAQALWANAQLILLNHREWVVWYTLITSIISFLICYRFGPVTNKRTKQIIQWFLQFLGLTLIYNGSHFREASISCCIILIIIYNFPVALIHKGKKYWKRKFPDPKRLLNDDEYRLEAIRETKKALDDLQGYCSSPDCNPWKTILRLKNPVRFAQFMEGGDHLSDDETRLHDLEISKLIQECEYTDDDDEL